jgi:hypothetical protein
MKRGRQGRSTVPLTVLALALVTLALVAAGCGSTTSSASSSPSAVTATVPDITGQTPSEANAALHAVSLKVGAITLEHSGDTPEGMIFRQSPEAGAEVDEGIEVAYVISKGEPPAPSASPSTTASPSPAASTVAATQPSATVKAMQGELAKAGYYTGQVDGIFGTMTIAAIKSAQRAAGLTIDGVYGPATHQAVIAVITGDDSSSQSSYSSKFIVEVQGDLKQLGYYKGAVDGLYGPKTIAAIKTFQKARAIAVTGNIDQGTYSYIIAALGEYAN